MKFIIILTIAIFAAAATSSPINEVKAIDTAGPDNYLFQGAIVQKLIEVIEHLVKKTERALQKVLETVGDIIQNINDQIQKLIDNSLSMTNKLAKALLAQLEEISRQNQISLECAEKSRPDVDVAIAEYGLEVRACHENALMQAQDIRKDIEPYVEKVRDNIDALQDIVSECLETTGTPFKLAGCIVSKTERISVQLLQLIKNAKDVVATGPKRSVQIISEARKCIQDSNMKFQHTMKDILLTVHQCIEDGQLKQSKLIA